MEQETITKSKIPTTISILLICSFANACLKIFSSLIMYFGTPLLQEMIANGQMEESMSTLMATANTNNFQEIMDSIKLTASINRSYYLITGLLYIVSLVGVTRMLKVRKEGFHLYSISQLCMILASSLYLSPLWSDIILTMLFVLTYYLWFRKIETEQE